MPSENAQSKSILLVT